MKLPDGSAHASGFYGDQPLESIRAMNGYYDKMQFNCDAPIVSGDETVLSPVSHGRLQCMMRWPICTDFSFPIK